MSEFTPKIWQNGDSITDVQLNRLEARVAELNMNNVFNINTLPTWNQVKGLLEQDIIPVIKNGKVQDYIVSIQKINDGSIVYVCDTLFGNIRIAPASDPNIALQIDGLASGIIKE